MRCSTVSTARHNYAPSKRTAEFTCRRCEEASAWPESSAVSSVSARERPLLDPFVSAISPSSRACIGYGGVVLRAFGCRTLVEIRGRVRTRLGLAVRTVTCLMLWDLIRSCCRYVRTANCAWAFVRQLPIKSSHFAELNPIAHQVKSLCWTEPKFNTMVAATTIFDKTVHSSHLGEVTGYDQE